VYTVKQLSDLANVSVRTLHYYDEIGLLHPSKVGANGYRYYDDAALLRLQQILFYREIGLELMHIKEILDSPDFDLLAALRSHRVVLQEKIKRLDKLVNTIDNTIMHLAEEVDMSKKQLFEAFSEEKQKHYERLARLQYGPERVNESIKRWNGYGQARQDSIREEGGQIYRDLAAALEAGKSAKSAEVQAMIERWHQHLGYFYEPTLDVLRGLAGGYNSHPDFIAFFHHLHPDLPDYLNEAIIQYVDDLETAEIARMLAEDEANKING
jgi:MerR family transcriptional regulator, thiopeptide resistance regulator